VVVRVAAPEQAAASPEDAVQAMARLTWIDQRA